MAPVPKRATKRGATIDPATKPTLAGAKIRPAVSASRPKPPAAKRGCASKAMSTSGAPPLARTRRCMRTNSASNMADAPPQAIVQIGHCRDGPSINASNSKANPVPTIAAPGQSIAAADASRDSGMWRAKRHANRPSGTLIRKMVRHARPNTSACTIQPPSTCPAMAASPSVMPIKPNARRRAWPS
ncbi:hypothetical protein G6F31_016979 [Rhizopus arrhizus]|nr:hypothetical protein G6F31_016979 [Rhizopus arrhizus]